MALYKERVVVYLDDATRDSISQLADAAGVTPSVYIRTLLQRFVAGDPLASLNIATTLDKVWIGVDALLKSQTWDPSLRSVVREIIERRTGRPNA